MKCEEYVDFETARLLKAAGFPLDIKRTMFYNKYGQDYHLADGYYGNGYAKPTQAQAMRWLREEHKISVEVGMNLSGDWEFYVMQFVKRGELLPIATLTVRKTYEAAAEAGIQMACKYLIEEELK